MTCFILHRFIKLLALIAATVVILMVRKKMMTVVGVDVLHVSLTSKGKYTKISQINLKKKLKKNPENCM